MKVSESEIQKVILDYLLMRGHYVWRNNSGAFKNERGGFYRFGKKGSADIIGVRRGSGVIIAVEVKAPGKKPTPEQNEFLKLICEHGGLGILAYSVEDVIAGGL